MSAIGREGGHSRGARARATSTSVRSDVERGGAEQSFERPTATERSSFESGIRNPERPLSSSRLERSGDEESRDHGSLSGSDQI
jgi:hypothetical protein